MYRTPEALYLSHVVQPTACSHPGNPDPGHTVTTKARYNPDTGKCETTKSVTGPHDCQRFETKADCRRDCEQ
ncbi:secreted salivary gland peptide, putative [Ixodes scapularis]|uniref:Secreted salivary gland peptide, putative n=1 Tax=Ixodes scapularis TaxID=6945 RepID=B7PT05_IXOSC|nr:secreted salivary gland peptide, putative [Ixodes scapularis]|eukprot:XP_002403476.1 secreted salivary gland peptide, putative [Ixodes scapularis]